MGKVEDRFWWIMVGTLGTLASSAYQVIMSNIHFAALAGSHLAQ